MKRGPDIGAALAKALDTSAAQAGYAIRQVGAGWTRWASATFQGARHHLTVLAAPDAGFDDWVAGLVDAELPISGHIVADLRVVALRRACSLVEADIEALTVEAA